MKTRPAVILVVALTFPLATCVVSGLVVWRHYQKTAARANPHPAQQVSAPTLQTPPLSEADRKLLDHHLKELEHPEPNDNSNVWFESLTAVAGMGPAATPAIPVLVELVRNGPPERPNVRIVVALPFPNPLFALFREQRINKDAARIGRARERAVTTLREIGPAALPALEALWSDAALKVEPSPEPDSGDPIRTHEPVRRALLRALTLFADPAFYLRLITGRPASVVFPDPALIAQANEFAASGRRRVLPILLEAVNDPVFKEEAVKHLAELRPPVTADLIRLLQHRDPAVRRKVADVFHVAYVMGGTASKDEVEESRKALPALTAALDDPDAEVRREAARTIESIHYMERYYGL